MKQQPGIGLRLATMIMDHVFMTFLILLLSAPVLFFYMSRQFASEAGADMPLFSGPYYVILAGFSLYLCKDSLQGRSIAKRLLKLQVIDKRTGTAAGPVQCMVRNIFVLIWPVEVILTLIRPTRRLGDYVAGTEVTFFDPAQETPKIELNRVLLSLVMAFLLIYLLILPFKLLSERLEKSTAIYNEQYKNDSLSVKVNTLLIDSLSKYLDPKLKVYNKPGDTNLVYVKGTLHLRADYNEEEENFDALVATTSRIIQTATGRKVKGHLKFIYESPGRYSARTRFVGE